MNTKNLPDFKVRVSCMTYNHANYIKDAMDGFCMQETDFPYICSIFDDDSTDGEQEVIQKYLEDNFEINNNEITFIEESENHKLIFSRHKTNLNCYFAVVYLKFNHYRKNLPKLIYLRNEWKWPKYFAFCEGDDYWTDSLKLQKQVDFLESHPDFSIVSHNAKIINETTFDFSSIELETREYDSNEVLLGARFYTATVLIRREALKPNSDKIIYDDMWTILCGLDHGRGYAFQDYMSVYRRHDSGVSVIGRYSDGQNSLDYIKNFIKINEAIKQSFSKVSSKTVNKLQSRNYYELIFKKDEGIKRRIIFALKSLYLDPKYFFNRIRIFIINKIK